MAIRTIELQLPLDADEAGSLARQRVEHLAAVDGVEPAAFVRLVRSFPSLRAVYAAPEAELAKIIGAVAAARLRWFIDAPLDTALAREGTAREASATTARAVPASLSNAA